MAFTARFLLITLIESFGTICVERGVYFFTEERLGFGDAANLSLALAFGVAYVGGALISHPLAVRFGEKRLLTASIAVQLAVHSLMATFTTAPTIFIGATLAGLLYGMKWPIIESYVSAGRHGMNQARSLGRFSIAWSTTVPLSLIVTGPVLSVWAPGVFVMPAAINVVTLWLLLPVHGRPAHLPDDHPSRTTAEQAARLQPLLVGSRWMLMVSYAAMFILAPLMPGIFRGLGYDVAVSTALSSVMDVTRVATFVGMLLLQGWHGRRWPIAGTIVLLPIGLFAVLYGGDIGLIIVGELIFGLAMGMVYYASIYYAVVVRNADVGAGGGHEGLIGAGFAIGPAAGLAGVGLQRVLGSKLAGTLVGLLPVLAVGMAMAVYHLCRPATNKTIE
jgi:Na+/melibiose symporter-like transporter